MANQSVGTPRFYVDFTQLFRAKGYYFWEEGLQNTNKLTDNFEESNNNIWNFDFYRPQEYTATTESPDFYFNTNGDKNFSRLAGISNWAGFFNHNFASSFENEKTLKVGIINSLGENSSRDITDLLGYTNRNGFSIGTFEEFAVEDIERVWLGLREGSTYEEGEQETFNVSCASFGRYYDMPNSPDLSIKKSIEYEGVETQRTLGGSDVIQINNYGSPDWISGEPFALVHPDESNSRVARHGRRTWQLKFSYISNDDLFFDSNRLNSFGGLDYAQGSENNIVSAGSEIQQIFDLTMSGGFSFIFCPDKDATDSEGFRNPEFAQCRLDQSSLSATQVAYQTWNISMNIIEVW